MAAADQWLTQLDDSQRFNLSTITPKKVSSGLK